jgi:superfamily II DNA or RNA helicase
MTIPVLRGYQNECIGKVYSAIRSGRTRMAVSMPTGSGKSFILAKIASDAAQKGKSTIILVHRKPLVQQLTQAVKAFGFNPVVIAAGIKSPKTGLVTIAMVQTLERRELPTSVDVIILDESHITSYFNVFERCLDKYLGKVWALSNKPVIGFSATFWRTNKKEGYCKYFTHKVEGVSPRQLIKQGYLTTPKLYTYETCLDLNKLTVESGGEFSLASIRKVCGEEYMQDVINKWYGEFSGKKTILFTSQVQQAEYFKSLLEDKGVSVEVVTGSDTLAKRNATLESFKLGSTQVIVNVSVLTEGFDEPSIECVVLARPTKSIALIVQMIGRALRLHPGKKEAIILDMSESVTTLLSNNQAGSDCEDEDDIFEFNNFSVCPSQRKRLPKLQTKVCGECTAVVSSFLAKCPECGHEFSSKEVQEIPDSVQFPQLIEFKTSKESKMFNLLRAKIASDFKQSIPTHNFSPADNWAYGAVFRGNYPEFNYQFYSWYLAKLGLPEQLTARCLRLEFGGYSTKLATDFDNWQAPKEPSAGEATAVNYIQSNRY